MNVYFLVEGKCTEMMVYPQWLSYLAPHLRKVDSYLKVSANHYFLFSGEGYPSLLNHLGNAISDVNDHGNFDYFVICLDVEARTSTDLENKIRHYLQSNHIVFNHRTQFVIVFQNKCIETWFLGNQAFYEQSPKDSVLLDYIAHYDVYNNDPELMSKPSNFHASVAKFHTDYTVNVMKLFFS